MALIPKYHTAVAVFAIDPADITSLNAGGAESTYAIYQGMVVGLNSSGYVKKASNAQLPLGLAGDSLAVAGGHMPYQADLIINPAGGKKSTQNRVSDYFNETLGSGLMSVYIVGGEFYTDMYVSGSAFVVGTAVKASNATPGKVDMSGSTSIGYCTTVVAGYPSGVPGAINAVDYSMPLATSFMSFVLSV